MNQNSFVHVEGRVPHWNFPFQISIWGRNQHICFFASHFLSACASQLPTSDAPMYEPILQRATHRRGDSAAAGKWDAPRSATLGVCEGQAGAAEARGLRSEERGGPLSLVGK